MRLAATEVSCELTPEALSASVIFGGVSGGKCGGVVGSREKPPSGEPKTMCTRSEEKTMEVAKSVEEGKKNIQWSIEPYEPPMHFMSGYDFTGRVCYI